MSDEDIADENITDYGMPEETASIAQAEEAAQLLAGAIGQTIPPGWGFVIVLAALDRGGQQATYISSIKREGARDALRELADHLDSKPRPIRALICEDCKESARLLEQSVLKGAPGAAIQVVATYRDAEAAIGNDVDLILVDGLLEGSEYRGISHGMNLVTRRREYEARFDLPNAIILGTSSDAIANKTMVENGADEGCTKMMMRHRIVAIAAQIHSVIHGEESP